MDYCNRFDLKRDGRRNSTYEIVTRRHFFYRRAKAAAHRFRVTVNTNARHPSSRPPAKHYASSCVENTYFDDDSAGRLSVDGHVEKHFRVGHCCGVGSVAVVCDSSENWRRSRRHETRRWKVSRRRRRAAVWAVTGTGARTIDGAAIGRHYRRRTAPARTTASDDSAIIVAPVNIDFSRFRRALIDLEWSGGRRDVRRPVTTWLTNAAIWKSIDRTEMEANLNS